MSGVYEIRMGAIYKFAFKRGLESEAVICLLTERLGMKIDTATQLCGHWFTSEKLKNH